MDDSKPQSRKRRKPPVARSKVGGVMRQQFISVSSEESLEEAFQIMRLARLRHLLVEDNGVLAGILTYRDLQDRALSGDDPLEVSLPTKLGAPVAHAMVDSPYTVQPGDSLAEAATRMVRLHIGCLPVVEESDDGPRLVGIITESDLLGAAYAPGTSSP